ncbi:hypothetical protein K1719_036937 [Acacia pycnantha]|nr:hypothetical protein K1719_036937 [Acacia pycnantha]
MFRTRDISFFLILFCVILLPQCTARNTVVDSSSLKSAPLSDPSQTFSIAPDSDPLLSSAGSLSGSIAEILKRAIIPKLSLNFSPSPEPNHNPNTALKSICDSTDYPQICVSRVSPMLSSGGVNPMSVLEASIKACIEPLHDAVSNMSSSSSGRTTSLEDASHSPALAECNENYKEALAKLQNALDSLQASDIETINSLLSAVVLDISTCDDAFKGVKESPVADFNELMGKMARNCLNVASLIHQ